MPVMCIDSNIALKNCYWTGITMHALHSNPPLRVDKSFEMPSIPLVLTKILQVLDDDTASAHKLEDLILHDPALAARILKLSNSAFYSFRTEVKTLSHAIALLGLGLVKSLTIGVTIFDSFIKGQKDEADLIHKLWMHSFGAGMMAQEIWTRRAHSKKELEFAFLCGLLHDLGKAVFFKRFPLHYSILFIKEKTAADPDICVLESESFGVDHAYIGSMLAKQWGFPSDLVAIIREHHSALDSKSPLVRVVALADAIAKEQQIGFDGDSRICLDVEKLQAQLGMEPEEYERMKATAEKKRLEIDRFFNVSS